MNEHKKQLNEYIVDREKLLSSINNKQSEIEYLREEIEQTGKKEKDYILTLRNKLELRTEELIKSQQQYIQVQETIDKSRTKLMHLTSEKDRVLTDRNLLKSEYDHLQAIMKDNVEELEILTIELEALKKQQDLIDSTAENNTFDISIQDLIEEKKSEMARLDQMNHTYELNIKELEKNLLYEVRRYSDLNGQFQLVQAELVQNEERLSNLKTLVYEYESNVFTQRKLVNKLELERIELQAHANSHEENYKIALMEYADMREQIQHADEEYFQSMVGSEEKIKELQNELAISYEKHGEPVEVSPDILKILEQEYEPRFKILYRDSIFNPEFFKDFYRLVPSDRLKVEASIVNINYNFELHKSKIRPNEVETRQGIKILEYPFGHDNVGRIYFRRASNEIQFYRISRTKNGKGKMNQNRVIDWLKANY